MDKQQILKLRKLNTEAADLRKRIKDFESKLREYVADSSASDYSTGFSHPIVIEGYGDNNYIKTRERLYNGYVRKLIEIQESIEELEKFLDTLEDPELRTILRLTCINGFTQEEIAEELGYSRSAVAMKIKRFFK